MRNKEINTNNMIALCHIIDEFDGFEKRLIQIVSQRYNRDFVFKLWNISQGKFKLGAWKVKRFYEENKSIIDTINEYSDIATFINLNYFWNGEPRGDLRFFYKYLLSHKEEIPQILELLEKLKELGFSEFEFNEDLDFTKEIYEAYSSFDRNFDLTYVANPQVIPNYLSTIEYKTANSNYKMNLEVSRFNCTFSDYRRYIILNSLLFDPSTLPEKLDKAHTFDKLLSMQKAQEKNSSIIRGSVDLSVSISDLELQFIITNEKINKLDGIKNKEELITVLASIKADLEKLETLSAEHNSSISQDEPSLTPEVLETEKTLYLKRRYLASIDLC